MDSAFNRRRFLIQGAGGISAVWISTHLPALLAAAEHAHTAVQSSDSQFEFFTTDEAKEIRAITSRIIPTFAAEDQKTYRDGLPELQARVAEMFPSVAKFSRLTPDQQDEVLHSLEDSPQPGQRTRRFRPRPGANDFFETVRQHTLAGFLIDPDYGGNHDGAGWKVIGREREHMFQPPFGYYDKDYPGWEKTAKDAEKK